MIFKNKLILFYLKLKMIFKIGNLILPEIEIDFYIKGFS